MYIIVEKQIIVKNVVKYVNNHVKNTLFQQSE